MALGGRGGDGPHLAGRTDPAASTPSPARLRAAAAGGYRARGWRHPVLGRTVAEMAAALPPEDICGASTRRRMGFNPILRLAVRFRRPARAIRPCGVAGIGMWNAMNADCDRPAFAKVLKLTQNSVVWVRHMTSFRAIRGTRTASIQRRREDHPPLDPSQRQRRHPSGISGSSAPAAGRSPRIRAKIPFTIVGFILMKVSSLQPERQRRRRPRRRLPSPAAILGSIRVDRPRDTEPMTPRSPP